MGIWFSVFTLSATHLSTATAVQSLHPSKDLESWFSGQVTGITSGGAGKCIEKNVDIHASAMNTKLNFELPVNQSQVTETIVEFLQVNATLLSEILGPKQNISGTYSISTKLCWPASLSSPNTSTIQLLTHGVGFDKCYWDFYSASYSYQNAAAKAGYTTLSYDRLGVGASDHPDPIQIVQAPLEIEIAHQLIQSLRHGSSPLSTTQFEKVIGRTHKRHHLQIPSDLDAAVLTGFSVDTTGQSNFFSGLNLVIAREDQPLRFSELNNGYLISQSVVSNQFGFFRAPNFDPLVLAAAEASKQTFTLGELFTNGMFVSEAKEFRGPIDVVDGENDLPFCQSNCLVPHDKAAVVKAALYPNAKGTSTSYVAEGAGHGLNLHYVAVEAYQQIFEFLKGNGF